MNIFSKIGKMIKEFFKKYFGWLAIGLASKSVFVPIQIAFAILLFTAHIVMFGFIIYAITFFYNKYNEFLALISNMSNGDEILTIALQLLQALGVINAFNDVFAIFSPFIIAYLVFIGSSLVFHSWQATSNEIFKVGVLTQQ